MNFQGSGAWCSWNRTSKRGSGKAGSLLTLCIRKMTVLGWGGEAEERENVLEAERLVKKKKSKVIVG